MRPRRQNLLVPIFASAVAAALASATVAPALAGSPYVGDADVGGALPGQQPSRPNGAASPPARRGPAGLFSCSYREQRTKLERKNCGGTRF